MEEFIKVEYLVLFDANKDQCKSVSALKSLLQSDSDISINNNKVFYGQYSVDLNIKEGRNEEKSHIYFNIYFQVKFDDGELDKFSALLRSIRRSLGLVTKSVYTVWDDLSLYYSNKAYPILFNIENLMRSLITKFMLTNLGLGWIKERVPTDVQNSIRSSNNDNNYLKNIDFIQLKNFLFSENYPNHKDSLVKEIKKAKDISGIDLDRIRSLLPESNWDRFFEPIVGCDAEFLKRKWDRLYELRCMVAHNKDFSKKDFEEVTKISAELEPILVKAISSLDDITLSESEIDSVVEDFISGYHDGFVSFINEFSELERVIDSVTSFVKSKLLYADEKDFAVKVMELVENGIIDEGDGKLINQAKGLKDKLSRGDFNLDPRIVEFYTDEIRSICQEVIELAASKLNLSHDKSYNY